MRIYLPITLRQTGGTSTFARKFQRGMQDRGHEVVFSQPKQYDILLASPRAPLRALLNAKQKQLPIVQRLDGVYYPAIKGALYPMHNASLWYIRKFFATALIYQSAFSKQSCDQFLGTSSLTSIQIYNGVDTNVFTPQGEIADIRDNPNQHVFITASRFRREDQIIPLLQAYHIYREQHTSNSKLVIIGNFESSVEHILKKWRHAAGVSFLGIVPHERLPLYLRAADAFVFTHRNPPCPNNVLEAMAAGLPICGVADGSMPELVVSGNNGLLAPSVSSEFSNERKVDLHTFARNMATIIAHKKQYSTAARTRATEQFSIDVMIDAYVSFIADEVIHA